MDIDRHTYTDSFDLLHSIYVIVSGILPRVPYRRHWAGKRLPEYASRVNKTAMEVNRQLSEQLASQPMVVFMPHPTWTVNSQIRDCFLKADGLHPSYEGTRRLGQELATAIGHACMQVTKLFYSTLGYTKIIT